MKKYKDKSKIKNILIYTALVVLVLSIVFFLATETGFKVRSSFVFKLIFNLIVCSALLFYIKYFETAGRIIGVCGVIKTLLFIFITADRIDYILTLVFAVVSGVTAMTLFLCKKQYIGSGIMTGFFAFKALSILRNTNIDNNNFVKLMLIALIVGVVVFLITIALAKFLKGANKEILSLKIGSSVLFLVVLFSFAIVIMANYALDFSSPTVDSYAIIETDVKTRPKRFEFKLKISNEENWLDVTEEIYYKYDIGDIVAVKTYKGAFGAEYKIVE